VFNDSFVLLYRRRWGLLFFAIALLFLYSGLNNLGQKPAPASLDQRP